jgi:hypothetical protein
LIFACPPDRAASLTALTGSRDQYDGYRLRLERDGDRVRLITRGGDDWIGGYPWIVKAALKNRHWQFVINGEGVVPGWLWQHESGTYVKFIDKGADGDDAPNPSSRDSAYPCR